MQQHSPVLSDSSPGDGGVAALPSQRSDRGLANERGSSLADTDFIWDDDNISNRSYELVGGVGLYQSLQSVQPKLDRQQQSHASTSNSQKSSLNSPSTKSESYPSLRCTCTGEHDSSCLEQYAFKLLFDAHVAISLNPRQVQQYPRTPSVASLLLLDTDSNPIVKVIGTMMQQKSPPSLANTVAVCYIMYRLLRVSISLFPFRGEQESLVG